MHEQARISLDDPLPTLLGLLPCPQPLVFLTDPAHQVGIDASQKGIQRRPIEGAVIVYPTSLDRVDLPHEVHKGVTCTQMKSPGPHFRTDLIQGVLADGGQERSKHPSVPVPRPASPERISEERERRVLMRAPPCPVPQ